MGVVSKWLTEIGLSDAIPAFRRAGISAPADLAALELDRYEDLGVTGKENRKKLFYLVSRIKMAVEAAAEKEHAEVTAANGNRNRDEDRSRDEDDKYDEDYEEDEEDYYRTNDEWYDNFKEKEEAEGNLGGTDRPDSMSPIPPPPKEHSEHSDDESYRESSHEEEDQEEYSDMEQKFAFQFRRGGNTFGEGEREHHNMKNIARGDGDSVPSRFDMRKQSRITADQERYSDTTSPDSNDENHVFTGKKEGQKREQSLKMTFAEWEVTSGISEKESRGTISGKRSMTVKSDRKSAKEREKATGKQGSTGAPIGRTEDNEYYSLSNFEDDKEGEEKIKGKDLLLALEENQRIATARPSSSENYCRSASGRRRSTRLAQKAEKDMPSSSRLISTPSSVSEKLQGLVIVPERYDGEDGRGSAATNRRRSARLAQKKAGTVSFAGSTSSDMPSISTGGTHAKLRKKNDSYCSSTRNGEENDVCNVVSTKSSSNIPPFPKKDVNSENTSNQTRSDSMHQSFDPVSSLVRPSSGCCNRGAGTDVASPELSDSSSISGVSQLRRHQSKLQHPTVSRRIKGNVNKDTKKRLSSIPSEAVAPMSPLTDISSHHKSAHCQQREHQHDQVLRSCQKNTSRVGRVAKKGTKARRLSEPAAPIRQDIRRRVTSKRRSIAGRPSSTGLNDRRNRGTDVCVQQSERSASPSRLKKSPRRQWTNSMRKGRRRTQRMTQCQEESSGSEPDESNVSTLSSSLVFFHGQQEDDSWATMVAQLREEKEAYYEKLQDNSEDEDDEDMRIRVVVRKRPMSSGEHSCGEVDVIHPFESCGRLLVYQPRTRVDLTKEIDSATFAFDDVFDEKSSNATIYERSVKHLIPGVFEREWVSVFAYGQTGSGKTYTMMGSSLTGMKGGGSSNGDHMSNLGLYFLAAQDVFRYVSAREFSYLSVCASLFEIYGGKLFDLLNKRKQVKCLEDHKGKVCFPGLSEHGVNSPEQLLNVIEAGAVNRSMGTTSANADSSRSHAVLQLSLRKTMGRKKNVEHGRLTFIDLAGSERGADTNNAGRTTRMEGAEINTSLLALKEVIRALATGSTMQHIPFRGSKLTQVLKQSFVGKKSRTVMITCVAPNMNNCEHTLNTLRYADRVKERNPETGKPAIVSVISSSRTNKQRPRDCVGSDILIRPASAPTTYESENKNEFSKGTIDRRSGECDGASLDEYTSANDETVGDDNAELDDFLPSPPPPEFGECNDSYTPHSSHREEEEVVRQISVSNDKSSAINANLDAPHKRLDEQIQAQVASETKRASKPLIANHRVALTEFLNIMKNEVILVNSAGDDRDSLENYMTEVEKLHSRKLDLMTSLRESLSVYYAARDSKRQQQAPMPRNIPSDSPSATDSVLSDDTFEDLRD